MKLYIKTIALFLTILLLLGAVIWQRYTSLRIAHLNLRETTFHSTYGGVVDTFELVAKTIAEEVLQQESITGLLHAIVTTQGEQQHHLRGLLYRELSPMYERIKQHSIRQLHFVFPDNRSMLRFHAPHKADDDLAPYLTSVKIANEQQREVHGYESGRIVHGYRHVYPLSYRGVPIGVVDISTSFQQIYKELIKHLAYDGSQYLFIMLKSDFLHKLVPGKKEMYYPSAVHDAYLCENSMSDFYNDLGGTAMVTEQMLGLQHHLRGHPDLEAGIKSEKDFTLLTTWQNKLYTVQFHPVKNIKGQHAAYIIGTHPEPYLQSLRSNMLFQFIIAVVFAGILTIFRVKLARTRAEQRNTTDFLQTLSDHMGEGLYATDKNGSITFINQEASSLLGYSTQELLHKNAHDLFHINNPQHQEQGCAVLTSVLNHQTYEQEQNVFQPKEGQPIPVEITCTPIMKNNEIAGTITLFHDISLRRQQEQELEGTQQKLKEANRHLDKLAHIDGLTKIANRRLFDQTLETHWKAACRNQKPISLLLMDIDHFKAYNDTYGHLRGDECLRKVAEIIQTACLRPEDFVARYGGEEFVALLPDTETEDAFHIAKRICTNLQLQRIAHQGAPTEKIVTLSIGVCSLQPDITLNPQKLIICADRRLYRAKGAGRNQICNT